MRRMTFRMLIAAAAAAASVVAPMSARAIPNTHIAQCSGTATPGGAASVCSATFVIEQQRDPQDIGTHANFHALTSMGSVEMDWYNQSGTRVAHYVCRAPGLYVHRATPFGPAVGAGPTDASNHTCTENISPEAKYALGTQTLVVTAKASMCKSEDSRSCPFHGLLALKRVSEPV